MAPKIRGLTVVINGDVSKLSKAMNQLKGETTALKRHLKAVSQDLKFNPSSVDLITQKQRLLSTAMMQTHQRLGELQKLDEYYSKNHDKLTDAQIANWNRVQRETSEVKLRQSEITDEMKKFGQVASVNTLAAQGRFRSLAETLQGATLAATALSAATAVVGYLSIKSAMDFESSFAGVRKTIDATENEYRQLADAARQMALTKPIDVNDVNYIMELGGQLGIASENLEVFANTIADLDVSTNLDLEDASMKLAQFANIVNMNQDEFDRLGAVIADLGNNTATTESMIVNMAMRIAGAGANIGMTSSQILALAASLSAVGIQAEMGGNAISTIMNRIDKDVALNTDTLSTWAATAGLSSQQFAEMWETNVMGALQLVIKGMGEYRDSGNNINLLLKDMEISYMRQVDTMQRLSRTSDLLNANVALANTAWDENIALVREANERYATAESKVQLMKNAINETGIVIGQEILPAFKDVVINVTDAVKAFGEMDDGTKSAVISFGALALAGSAAVPILWGVGKAGDLLIGTYAKLKTSLYIYTATQGASVVATEATAAAMGKEAAAVSFTTVAKDAATIATNKLTAAQVGLTAASTLAKAGLAILAVAGVALLTKAIAESNERTEGFTAATRRQQDELIKAEAAYRRAASGGREHTEVAQEAYAAFLEEQSALEATTETFGQFCDRMNDTIQAHQNLVGDIQDTADAANAQSGAILNLADDIEALAGAENKTAEQKATLAILTSELNASVEGMGLVYDEATDSLNMTTEAMQGLARAEANRLTSEAAMTNYKSLLAEEQQLVSDLAEAEEELAIETERGAAAAGTMTTTQIGVSKAQLDLQEATDGLTASLEDNRAKQARILEILRLLKSESLATEYALHDMSDGTMTAAEAAAYYSDMFGVAITETDLMEAQAAKLAETEMALADAVQAIANGIDALSGENEVFAEMLANSGYSVNDLAQKMYDAGIEVDDLREKMQEYADTTANAFDKIEEKSDISLDSMLETLEHNIQTTSEWSSNIVALYDKAGNDSETAFINHIASLGVEYAPIVQALLDDSTGKLSELSQAWATAVIEGKEAALYETGLFATELSQATGNAGASAALAFEDSVFDLADVAGATAEDTSTKFAAGIESGIDDTRGFAEQIADATKIIGSYQYSAYNWGVHLALQFGNGLKDNAWYVEQQARNIADKVYSYLHFTHPDVGPLKEGTEIYGRHLVEDYAAGMRNALPKTEEAALLVASGVIGNLGSAMRNVYGDTGVPAQLTEAAPSAASLYGAVITAIQGTQTGEAALVNQTINFNQPVRSAAEVARVMKQERTYGLAGAR